MSYLKKLKELIGEDLFKKVEADLGTKDLIVNDGTYIPKEKFDKLNDEKKDLVKEKEKLTGDLKTAQDSLKKSEDEKNSGNKSVDEKIAKLEKDLKEQNDKIAAKDKELRIAKHEGILKDSLTAAGVTNPKNLKLLMKEFDLEKVELTEDGKIKGFDDSIKKLQEDYKPLFGEEHFAGTPPTGKKKGEGEDIKEMSTEEFFETEVFGGGKK